MVCIGQVFTVVFSFLRCVCVYFVHLTVCVCVYAYLDHSIKSPASIYLSPPLSPIDVSFIDKPGKQRNIV